MTAESPGPAGRSGRRGRGRSRGERLMVPDATFSSYYGRPVIKPPVWEELDIGGYLFTGGLAAGSSIIAAGADMRDLPQLRRVARLTSLGALTLSFAGLVHDLGRPARFVNMLRVLKPTSPMSVGTWILSAYAPGVVVGAVAELPAITPPPVRGLINAIARPGGIAAALIAPAVATYTAVLFADTSVPTWHEPYRELPFLFAGSALAASSGVGMMAAPVRETVAIRRLAIAASALDLAAGRRMESKHGLVGEPLHTGKAGRKLRAAKLLTGAGAAAAAMSLATQHRPRVARSLGIASGAALVTGSLLTRLGFFEAGVESAKDPKYVVVPQRERANAKTGRA